MTPSPDAKSRRVIHRSNALPVYRQVADLLEKDVRNQRSSGEKIALPSESELAAEFDVSRVTVRQALDRLHVKGLIYREKGRGSYVRSPNVACFTGLGSFTSEVERSGARASSKLLALDHVSSLPEDMLRHVIRRSSSTDGFFRLARLRLVNGEPVAREDAYLPAEVYPGLTGAHVAEGSLYAAMRDHWGYEPAWADAAIEPGIADEELALQLTVPVGAPLVVAWRVTSTDLDEVLEYVRSVYRGDGFALTINRHKLA